MEIEGRTALVTGASGFIGGHLARRLATEEGLRVRAMVRNPERADRLRALPLEVVQADLFDPESIRKALMGCDLVFHCAAMARETGDRALFYRTNVEGTVHLLTCSKEVGIKRFVHFSSVAVYGMSPPKWVDETTPFQPCGNPYCDTKIEAEKAVWRAFHEGGVPVVVIRPAHVYGPHSNAWTLRPIKLIRSGQMILIDGGGGLCNHVYVDNLLDAVLAATRNDHSVGQSYLISDGHPVTWREFFGYYGRMAGKPYLRSVPAWLGKIIALGMEIQARLSGRPPKISREAIRYLTSQSRFSIEKARRELGFEPRISLEEGMKRTEQWLREAGYLPQASS